MSGNRWEDNVATHIFVEYENSCNVIIWQEARLTVGVVWTSKWIGVSILKQKKTLWESEWLQVFMSSVHIVTRL